MASQSSEPGASSEPKLDLDGGSSEPHPKKRKISKLIEDMAQSVTLLQEQEKSLKSHTPDLKEIEEMSSCVKAVSDFVEQLMNRLSVKKVKISEVIFSWRTKDPHIMPAAYTQTNYNCWAVALYRLHYALSLLNGQKSELTIDKIFQGVDCRFTNGLRGAINKIANASSFMEKHCKKMTVYRRPRLSEKKLNEEFDALIEKLLVVTPVAVAIDAFPSYLDWGEAGAEGVYVPSRAVLATRGFEKYSRHTLFLTAHGIQNGIPFFEGQDSFGVTRGDGGFIRFARHHGFVRELIVLEL